MPVIYNIAIVGFLCIKFQHHTYLSSLRALMSLHFKTTSLTPHKLSLVDVFSNVGPLALSCSLYFVLKIRFWKEKKLMYILKVKNPD